ncbi:hypothetical protein GX408_18400 [bacterium]|nr:hypothetical protein [bacterium]
MKNWNALWTPAELEIFAGLHSPALIQEYLDSLAYSADDFYRCPRRVQQDHKAHCFDGALFAAAALRRLGFPPLIIDLLAHRDDDHLLALYRVNGCWGAVAKSNFVGLRFREPIHRSLRELVLTYFPSYYNMAYEKSLRGYTTPLQLERFDHLDWMRSDAHLEQLSDELDLLRSYSLMTRAMIKKLSRVDERTYQAGQLGADQAGIYWPEKS